MVTLSFFFKVPLIGLAHFFQLQVFWDERTRWGPLLLKRNYDNRDHWVKHLPGPVCAVVSSATVVLSELRMDSFAHGCGRPACSSHWEVRKTPCTVLNFGGCPCQDRSGRCPVWIAIAFQSVDSQPAREFRGKKVFVRKVCPLLLRWHQPYRIQKHICQMVSCPLCCQQQWKVESHPKICSTWQGALNVNGQTMYPMKPAVSFDRKAILI